MGKLTPLGLLLVNVSSSSLEFLLDILGVACMSFSLALLFGLGLVNDSLQLFIFILIDRPPQHSQFVSQDEDFVDDFGDI